MDAKHRKKLEWPYQNHNVFSALPLNIFLIDLVGRRWTGAINLFGCGLFFVLLQLPVPKAALTVFMFLVRGFSSGMFNFVYIYTSEVINYLSILCLFFFFLSYILEHKNQQKAAFICLKK